MNASVFIMPEDNRSEALEAYAKLLTLEQVKKIEDAPESAIINIRFGVGEPGTKVVVIEEG